MMFKVQRVVVEAILKRQDVQTFPPAEVVLASLQAVAVGTADMGTNRLKWHREKCWTRTKTNASYS